MRATVFTDAALVNHAGRFVWLSIDLTNPVNSSFLEQFPLDGLPMLVVIDPNTGQGVLKWMGTLDVHQLVGLLDDGERAMPHPDEPGGPDATVEADRLAGAGRYLPAARAYRRVLRALPSDAPERGRVAVAYVGAYQAAEAYRPCARAAVEVAPTLPPGDRAGRVLLAGLQCGIDDPHGERSRSAVIPLMEAALEVPGITADDRSSYHEALTDAYALGGDDAAVVALAGRWWTFLDLEASKCRTPEARAAFDAHRLLAAQRLGDPARVIPILEASERDFPDLMDPPARLTTVYIDLQRWPEALAANERAFERAYGWRKARMKIVRAEIMTAMGDRPGASALLDEALAIARGLPQTEPVGWVMSDIDGARAALDRGPE